MREVLASIVMVLALPFLLAIDAIYNRGPRPKAGSMECDVKYPREPGWSVVREKGWVKFNGVSKRIGAAAAGAGGNTQAEFWFGEEVFDRNRERVWREMNRFVETGELPCQGGLWT